MNISRENIDNLSIILKVEVEKADYEEKVEKVLRDYRKKANLKGFRPGMVPIGIIRKMFGTAAKADEINKLVSESITNYLTENSITNMGEPIPIENSDEKIDFERQEKFEFKFELGIEPEFEIKLSKKNKVPFYEITPDEKIRNEYIENYKRRYGNFITVDISGESDILKGIIEQVKVDSSDTPVRAEGVTIAINVIDDKEIKKEFTGKKVGDAVIFDIKKAIPNNSEIAGLLKITKEKAEKIEGDFRFTIEQIQRFVSAELNQELFDMVYGKDVVKSEEEFIAKVEEEISANLNEESNFKLSLDLKKYVLDRVKFDLPETFLKKWMLKNQENPEEEQIDKYFGNFLDDLRWQLIIKKIIRDNQIKITEEEVIKEAEEATRYKFHQYGIFYVTDEQVSNFALDMLKKNEDETRKIMNRLYEKKALDTLKEMVTLDAKKVSLEEFDNLFK